MRKRTGRIATVVALIAVLSLPVVAHAAVYEFGVRSCGDRFVGIRSNSTQVTTHFVLEPYYYTTGSWDNGATWKVRTSATGHKNNVEWGVEVVGGLLSDSGTYGYCTQYV